MLPIVVFKNIFYLWGLCCGVEAALTFAAMLHDDIWKNMTFHRPIKMQASEDVT